MPTDHDAREPLLRGRSPTRKPLSSSAQHIEELWDDESNTTNPRNWSLAFRWMTVALVSFIEFLTTMPNFMYAPNITDAQRDLHTDNDTLATLSLTIYVLGFALGPLLFAPLSEMYGRTIVYRVCLALFLICTAGCALSSSIGLLITFRVLAGAFGAAPVAIGGAVVGDLFETSKRGTAMSIYQAGQIISAVVGPPVGGVIADVSNWRWVFWIVCIMTGLALVLAIAVFYETHAPTVREQVYGKSEDDHDKKLSTELSKALSRPLTLLAKSPVVQSSCLLIFIVIGVLNLFLTEISRVFQKVYDLSSAELNSAYLGLGLGFVLASLIFGSTNDRLMRQLTIRNNGETQPEFRLPAAIVAMPLVVVGLLWYGWTLHFRKSWLLPTIGSGIAGLGITTVQLSITTYTVDSFDEFSASALAAITTARSIGGAILPLLGPIIYAKFGQGAGNTLFASITLLSCVFPVLLYIYGQRWRSKFSTNDLA